MIRTLLEKLTGWIRQEYEAASYRAATEGVSNGLNAAIRDLTAGSVTAELRIDGSTLKLSEATHAATKPRISPEAINNLRRKNDAIALADEHGIDIDQDGTLAEMREQLHAAASF